MSTLDSTLDPLSDLLESSLIPEPKNATERVLSMIFDVTAKNRDRLGFPKGSANFPYFLVSNDVCLKVMQFIKLMNEKEVPFEMEMILGLFENLIAAYDDDTSCACCRHCFSVPKETIVEIFAKIKARIE